MRMTRSYTETRCVLYWAFSTVCLYISYCYLQSSVLKFVSTAIVISGDPPCRCSCAYGKPFCIIGDSEQCRATCESNCLKAYHTVNIHGKCLYEENCTCVLTYSHSPVCAVNTTSNKEVVFKNRRHLYCINVCHNYLFKFLHKGICENLSSSEEDEEGVLYRRKEEDQENAAVETLADGEPVVESIVEETKVEVLQAEESTTAEATTIAVEMTTKAEGQSGRKKKKKEAMTASEEAEEKQKKSRKQKKEQKKQQKTDHEEENKNKE